MLLFPSLQEYLGAFVEILSSDLPHNSDHWLRKKVIMTLCHLLRSFTPSLTPHIMSVVTPVWSVLTQQTCMLVYIDMIVIMISAVFSYLNSVVNCDCALEEACDSDGEVISQESTIFAVFEFINVLGESEEFQSLLLPILPQLMYYLIVYMQITNEQVGTSTLRMLGWP